jgi:PXPV repeat-containing protein
MKKLLLASILFLVLLVPASSMARTDVSVNLGLGIPAPVIIAPNIVFIAPPPPIFVAPAPVIVAPAPAIVVQPDPVIVGHPVRHKHHRHIKFEKED